MIEITQLTKRFGDFTAVKGISFRINKGEVFGFLGANGAGKTTTIRMMCGLLDPSSGEITVDGNSVVKEPEKVKQKLGYMSQKFSLYSDLSPEWNIEFFAAVYGVDTRRMNEEKKRIRDEIGASAFKRPAAQLPLGYKQRLGLSCALLHSPPIIFLDEPTSGVDPLGRREFWESIYELSSSGKTVLVTTHFMDEAEYCDRIGIMSFGRLIELDSPGKIKEKYDANSLNDAFISAIENDRSNTSGVGEGT